ncbi:MAG: alpha/beta hydrolase-fold protein [Gemella sp.]|nr:alpha/beta hydrolase-fold protein [Gemella sp.]
MNNSYFYLDLRSHELPFAFGNRRIRVLLPKGYEESTESYPVVYMQDGQNVFHSREAYSGHSWKTVHAIKKNPDLPKMIIVGIDNGEEQRMFEYSAWKFDSLAFAGSIKFGGKGGEYADFVMHKVKPFIDQTYRTKSDAKHTAMIGSSLGANISQFMGVEYKDQIGGLGIFSSANWLTRADFARYIERNSINKDQRVFIQVGTQEGDDTDRTLTFDNLKQAYIDESLLYYKQLLKAGLPMEQINLVVAADGKHTEEEWAKHLPDCLRFLSENW